MGTGSFEKVERIENVLVFADRDVSSCMLQLHRLPPTVLRIFYMLKFCVLSPSLIWVRATQTEISSPLLPGVQLNNTSHHFCRIYLRLRLWLEEAESGVPKHNYPTHFTRLCWKLYQLLPSREKCIFLWLFKGNEALDEIQWH